MKLDEKITLVLCIWNVIPIFLICIGMDKSRRGEELGASLRKSLLILAFTCGGFGAWLAGIIFHPQDSKMVLKQFGFLGW